MPNWDPGTSILFQTAALPDSPHTNGFRLLHAVRTQPTVSSQFMGGRAERVLGLSLPAPLLHTGEQEAPAAPHIISMTLPAVSPQEKVEMQRQRFRLEFEKHRGFLAQEEQLQLRRLEEEERATLQRLRDSRNRLAQQNKALKELAEELEEKSKQPALGLLEVRQTQRMGGRCEAKG